MQGFDCETTPLGEKTDVHEGTIANTVGLKSMID